MLIESMRVVVAVGVKRRSFICSFSCLQIYTEAIGILTICVGITSLAKFKNVIWVTLRSAFKTS